MFTERKWCFRDWIRVYGRTISLSVCLMPGSEFWPSGSVPAILS